MLKKICSTVFWVILTSLLISVLLNIFPWVVLETSSSEAWIKGNSHFHKLFMWSEIIIRNQFNSVLCRYIYSPVPCYTRIQNKLGCFVSLDIQQFLSTTHFSVKNIILWNFIHFRQEKMFTKNETLMYLFH